jgi:hypothetical protein
MKVRHGLDTGDLLLFEGRHGIDQAIQFFTQSRYGHVGIVWRCPVTGKRYVWESGQPTKRELPVIALSDVPTNGAHLTPLQRKLENYYGKIYVRRLYCAQQPDWTLFHDFIRENLGREYRDDFVGMWNNRFGSSLLPIPFVVNEGDNWHCVELAVKTYERLGIMSVAMDTGMLFGFDLVEDSWHSGLEMQPGFHFGPTEYLCSGERQGRT